MLQSLTNILTAEPFRLVLAMVAIMAFVGLNAAYLVWVERKGAARFQRRPGPNEVGPAGLLQPIADAIKLLSKQLIVPAGVDRTLFRLAPLSDVAEDDHHAGKLATLVTNWRCSELNRVFLLRPADQRQMVGK